jgi:hypothetical protein
MIQRVMEHIVEQTIPAVVINNPEVDWNPFANVVTAAAVDRDGTPRSAAAFRRTPRRNRTSATVCCSRPGVRRAGGPRIRQRRRP